MKRISFCLVCNLFMLCFLLCCKRSDSHGINLSISESNKYYSIVANYNKRQTTAVDNYLDEYLAKGNNMSFTNTSINADLKLDNGTKFYIKKYPGYLKIKFNKHENSSASYAIIKHLGEGIKPVIQ